MMHVRPWRLLAASELAAIQSGLAQRVLTWQQSCLPAGPALSCTVQAARAGDAAVGQLDCCLSLLGPSGQVSAQLHCDDALLLCLQEQAGLGADVPARQVRRDSLARRACLHLLRELLAVLAGLQAAGSAGMENLFSTRHPGMTIAHGSGAVRLDLGLAQGVPPLQVLLSHELVLRWCQPRPKARGGLSARQGLADRLNLAYRVTAGSVELPLSALMQLEPGDVLRFDARAEHGLQLVSQSGAALCRAGIGLHAGQVVLQVCGE